MLFPGFESGRYSLLFLLLALCCLVWLACGVGPGSPVDSPGVSSVRSPGVPYARPATATPWPTFTPAPPPPSPTAPPTATPAVVLVVEAPRAVPSGSVFPTPTGAPGAAVPALGSAVSGGGASAAAPDGDSFSPTPVPSSTPVPSPTPVPYGKVPGEEVYFHQQSFFPLQVSRLPEHLRSGNPDVWPRSVKVVSSETRYVVWAVAFDVSSAPDDFVLEGFIRWTDVTPGVDPLIMLESPKRVSKVERLFYTGLGRGTPGFWKRGVYRVEFMDDEFESFLSWEFEVR